MRTGTSERSWDKGKNKEQEEKGNENPNSGLSSNCRNGVTTMPVVATEKRNGLTEFEAVRRQRWWPQM